MKKLLIGLLALCSISALASTIVCDLGDDWQREITDLQEFIDCEYADYGSGACYDEKKPWKARLELKKMGDEDFEKTKISSWYNKKDMTIDFSFVDTKCLDDDYMNTESDCKSEYNIPACTIE
jgi:hypothetical protein